VSRGWRLAAIAALLALAGTLAFAAHESLGAGRARSTRWDAALARARQAQLTKPIVPALQLRGEAIAMFSHLAQSGAPADRSRAVLLAALLDLESGELDAGSRTERLGRAVEGLQTAIRLDAANDDAAFEFELLLQRSKQQGKPINIPRIEQKKRRGPTHAGLTPPGTGY
jgi:hypothetical protein